MQHIRRQPLKSHMRALSRRIIRLHNISATGCPVYRLSANPREARFKARTAVLAPARYLRPACPDFAISPPRLPLRGTPICALAPIISGVIFIRSAGFTYLRPIYNRAHPALSPYRITLSQALTPHAGGSKTISLFFTRGVYLPNGFSHNRGAGTTPRQTIHRSDHMQNVNETTAPVSASIEAAPVAIVAAPAKAKRAPKAKPATVERVAKPDTSTAKADASAKRDAERAANLDSVRAARKLAADAVRTYYSTGSSLPFKAAADRFAAIRLDKPAKKPSVRQAALFASMLLSGDNVKANGTFTRGGFVIDGRNVQPETGCLSDAIGRAVRHVSGPLDGANARDAVFRFDLVTVRAEITSQLGGALAKAALARLDALGVKAPVAKPAKA